MKKNIFLVLALLFCAVVYADTQVSFSGYQWLRYEMRYMGTDELYSIMYVPRTYLTMDLKDEVNSYSAKLTLDINNLGSLTYVPLPSKPAATNLDWLIWIKTAYVEFPKILTVLDTKVRVGIQPVYFGTLDRLTGVIEIPYEDTIALYATMDFGTAITGKILDGMFNYEIGIYNGSGYKKLETNFEKLALGSLQFNIANLGSLRGSYFKEGARTATSGLIWLNWSILEGYAEYLVSQNKVSVGAPLVTSEGISCYFGVKVYDQIQLVARYDTYNPDTRIAADEWNRYIAGVNYEAVAKRVIVMIDYQLKQPKFPTGSNHDNDNLWMTQIKWSW